MRKQIFGRIKKILCLLMLVFFVMSVTAASVNAAPQKNEKQWGDEKKKWDNERKKLE